MISLLLDELNHYRRVFGTFRAATKFSLIFSLMASKLNHTIRHQLTTRFPAKPLLPTLPGISQHNAKSPCDNSSPASRTKRKETSFWMSLFFWCGDFAARKPRPPAAALDMAPTPGQKRRRQRPSPFLLVNSQPINPPISGTPLSGGPSIASSWSPSGILKSSSASSPKKPFQPPSIIKASSTTISSWPSISSRW